MVKFSPRMGWSYPARDDDPWYDPFVDFVQGVDASAYAHREDRSVIWTGGGTLSWTAASGAFTWTDVISIYSPLSGRLLQIAAGSITGWAEGEVVYVPLVRLPLTSTAVTLTKALQVPADDNAMALAARVGDSIFFRTGISLGNGDTVVGVAPVAGGGGTDPNAIHDNAAGEIAAIAVKAVPTTSDLVLIEDAADSNSKKSVAIGTFPAATPAVHTLGGSSHGSSTLAQLNAKVSDATLDDSSAPRTPTSHATSHQSGGGDAIKLDDLAAPDDNTDLDSTISAHGLLPKLGGGTTNYLRADGTWAAPPGGTDANAIHDNVAAEISAITEKTSPADADLIIIEDSEDSNNKKKVQVGNLPGGTATTAGTTSYRELATNALDTQGVSVVENDVGEGVFAAGLHQSVVFRATLTASWATTGTLTVSLYDDGPTSAPGTPRLVATLTKTADGGYEVEEQALAIVASGASTNEVLGEARVYRVTIEVDGSTGDTGYIGSAGFVATGASEALSADQVQAIAMSLNA